MTKQKLPILFFLLACWLSATVRGQNLPGRDVPIASPNAASLGKYADIPVNTHTGIPSISIPIYTAKQGELSLPISLSYHAGGLKVGEQASWVGAGWTLNAGGVITRTVQGQPDERGTSATSGSQDFGYLSDRGYPNYLWYHNTDNSTNPNNSVGTPIYLKDINGGKADGEPDLFFFNFNGYSGKFYFGDDGVPVLIPQQDVKVEYKYTPGLWKSIESFVLTTSDGTRYFFGYTDDPNDFDPVERSIAYDPTTPSGYGNEGRSISSWYLNKVESSDGEHIITLAYQSEKYSYYTLTSSSVPFRETAVHGTSAAKVYVEGARLSQISFPNGKVDFVAGALRTDLSAFLPRFNMADDPNQEARVLGEILIKDAAGNGFKKFAFSYDYFVDNSTFLSGLFVPSITSDTRRLKLLQVQEFSADNAVSIPPHVFEYYDGLVPRKLSFAQDHWGFYNGAYNPNTMIPTITEDDYNFFQGADRDAKWPQMRGGTLKKITYPTGGYSEFDFDAHTTWVSYFKYVSTTAFSMNAGYDGGYTPIESYQNLSANTYKVTLNNTTGTGSAQGTVYNSAGQQVRYFSVGSGSTTETYLQLPAGTYRITLVQWDSQTNTYVTMTFTEMVPTQVSKNETVGGLRIKTLKHRESPASTEILTNYTYEVNNQSTGILYSRPVYVQAIKNSGPRYIYSTLFMNGATWRLDAEESMLEQPYFSLGGRKTIMSPAAIMPMRTTQGNHIGYNEVKVSQTGNGYSIFRYYGSNLWDNDHSDVCVRKISNISGNPEAPEYPAAPLPYEYQRGELKYEGHWREDGKLLRDVTYIPTYEDNPVTTPGVRVYTEDRSAGAGYPYFVSAKTDFELHSYKKTKLVILETNWDVNSMNAVSTTKTILYDSPNHSQQTSEKVTNSKGEELTTKLKYAFDFTSSACAAIDNCWNNYQTALQNSYNTYIAAYNACTSDDCRKLEKYNYNSRNMQARRDYAACRRQKLEAYASCLQSVKSTADGNLKPIVEMQQRNINAPLQATAWKGGKLIKASYNVYTLSSDPTPKVYLDRIQNINLAAASTSFTEASVSGSGVVKDSRYVDEELLKYAKGNLVELTKKDGLVNAFYWGYKNNLPTAKAINAKGNEIFFDSYEEKEGWEGIISPQYGDAPITAYDPLKSRAGKHAARIDKPTSGEYYTHSNKKLSINLTADTKYKLSGWVYSSGPSADIYLFMYRQGETSYYSYVDNVSTSVTGKWVYIEKDITVPYDVKQLNVRIDNNGGGTVWFDDIRLHPSEAQMTAYTYDPLVGMTSQTDVNNRTMHYRFDVLGRLALVLDQDKNILKKICYNYKGQPGECTVNTTPLWQATGNYRCVVDGSGNNTGYQEREEKDNNPNSTTYNQLRWVDNGYNATACPLPSTCNYSNCDAQGEGYACIYGQCEYGFKVYTASSYDPYTGMYECIYHYEYSDYSWSQDYSEYSSGECPLFN